MIRRPAMDQQYCSVIMKSNTNAGCTLTFIRYLTYRKHVSRQPVM